MVVGTIHVSLTDWVGIGRFVRSGSQTNCPGPQYEFWTNRSFPVFGLLQCFYVGQNSRIQAGHQDSGYRVIFDRCVSFSTPSRFYGDAIGALKKISWQMLKLLPCRCTQLTAFSVSSFSKSKMKSANQFLNCFGAH